MEETASIVEGNPSFIAVQPPSLEVLQSVLIGGDLSSLNKGQLLEYYASLCKSLHLNPLSKPFEKMTLNGKTIFYATRNCGDQLRFIHKVSIEIKNRETLDDLYVVTVRATMPDGRHDEKIGAVPIGGLKGEAKANALMKCETKASRRVTLAICGLSMLDELEVETISQQRQPGSRSTTTEAQRSDEPEEQHPTADQVSSLAELAKACGVDLVAFGHHMRHWLNLAEETKVTKKFLRETLTIPQFEMVWQHYSELLKKHVEEEVLKEPAEEDVPDFPPGSTTDTPQDVSYSPPPEDSTTSPADTLANELELEPSPEYATSDEKEAVRIKADSYGLGQMFADRMKNHTEMTPKRLHEIEQEVERHHQFNLDRPARPAI
jgi:hypothetical protein